MSRIKPLAVAFAAMACLGGRLSQAEEFAALEWRPQQQVASPGQIVEVGLYVVPTGSRDMELIGLQVILDWDPALLELVDNVDPCDDPDACFVCPQANRYNWFISGFPDDCDYGGLNAPCPGFPDNDGDAFYASFVQVLCNGQSAPRAVATPEGFWVTTFRFRVLSTEGTAFVDIVREVGGTRTIILAGGPWQYDALRVIGPAARVDIVACATPVARAAGPRYLEVRPADGLGAIGLRIAGGLDTPELSCLPAYVQTPERTCVGGARHDEPCSDGSDCPRGTCRSSSVLGPDPVYLTPVEWGTVYVRSAAVGPAATYEVAAECAAESGPSVSTPETTTTWSWGDVNNDGRVNFVDIGRVVNGFKGIFSDLLTLEMTDLTGPGCEPDRNVSFKDISAAVEAFREIPFSCSAACP